MTATNGSLGNLLDDGVSNYIYDVASRLVQCAAAARVSGTLTTIYTYNGDGHWVAKTEGGETTSYTVTVLGLSRELMETTAGESVVYLYGHDGSASFTTNLLADEAETWQSETSALKLPSEVWR